MQIWLVLNLLAQIQILLVVLKHKYLVDYDGFIYKMETGNTFAAGATNNTIQAVYRTPDMVMGDPGLRKYMQRVNLNYEGEGTTIDANLAVRYDYDDQNTPQPTKIALPSVGGAGNLWTSIIW